MVLVWFFSCSFFPFDVYSLFSFTRVLVYSVLVLSSFPLSLSCFWCLCHVLIRKVLVPPKSQCRIWAMDRIRPNDRKKNRGKLLQPSVGPQKSVSPPHPSTPLPWPSDLALVRRSDIFGHVRWKPLEPVALCAGSRAHSQVRTTSGFFLLPPALFINLQIQTCR